jgi:hypothetical protein
MKRPPLDTERIAEIAHPLLDLWDCERDVPDLPHGSTL